MTQSNPIAAFASYQPHSAMMTARKRYRLPLSPPSREWQYIPVHSSKIKELPKISPNGGDDDDEDDVTYPSSFSSSEGTTFGDIEELIAADADVPPLLLDQSQKVTTITSVTTTSNFWTDFTATMPGDSILLLNIVAIIWGSQHAVIKTCIEDLNPSSFSLVRFLLAALIATPAWYLSKNENSDEASGDEAAAGTTSSSEIAIKSSTAESSSDLTTTWRWGVEMGLWMFLGYAFQAVGLAVRIIPDCAECIRDLTYVMLCISHILQTILYYRLTRIIITVHNCATIGLLFVFECQIGPILCLCSVGPPDFHPHMGICLDSFGWHQSTCLRRNVASLKYRRPLVHCRRCRIGHVYFAPRIGVGTSS
jgi:hypothetical protein